MAVRLVSCLANRFSAGELFTVRARDGAVTIQMIDAATADGTGFSRAVFFHSLGCRRGLLSEIAPNYEWMAHGELIFDETVYLDFSPLIYAMVWNSIHELHNAHTCKHAVGDLIQSEPSPISIARFSFTLQANACCIGFANNSRLDEERKKHVSFGALESTIRFLYSTGKLGERIFVAFLCYRFGNDFFAAISHCVFFF